MASTSPPRPDALTAAEGRHGRAWRRAIAITLLAGIARLAIGAFTPLFPDETYYWEWSRRLAFGYFDHPPVIAWLIRAGTTLFGPSELGVRFGPILAGVTGALFLCAAARRLAGDRGAIIAAMLFAVMPLSSAGLVLATPDAPLLAAAAATVYALIRALEEPAATSRSLRWWCVAGLALGLSFASKYTAVLLPAGVLIAFAARRDLRVRFREPGPYVATAIAIAVFVPVIVWNARHEWISFAFQLQHGLSGSGGSMLKRELDMIGGQAGLVSPILFVMLGIAVARQLRGTPTASLLATMAMFVFAFFMYSATKRRVEANWPALAYIPGTLLLASLTPSGTRDRWLRAGIVLAAVLTLVTYVNSFVPILPVPAARDPNARAYGWDQLARAVGRIHTPLLAVSSHRTWVAADRYQEASELAFHLPDAPQTFALNLHGRPNQYDLWTPFRDIAQPGDALVLVVDDGETHPVVEKLRPEFGAVQRGKRVALARDGDVIKPLRIWFLTGWRGTWPAR